MQQIVEVNLVECIQQLLEEVLCFIFRGCFFEYTNVSLGLRLCDASILFNNLTTLLSFLLVNHIILLIVFLLFLRLNCIVNHGSIIFSETRCFGAFV